ncbi:MAG: DUF4011 domain-containing protein, partial [Planctomycetaceae bacterium]|nr:DUF4011 domain-containing protein [Planctomycetaceae bacterium]
MKFRDFLTQVVPAEGLATDDVLASILPLFREVIETHRADQVAPLEGLEALHVEQSKIWFETAKRLPIRTNTPRLQQFEAAPLARLEVVAEMRRTSDVSTGDEHTQRSEIGDRSEPLSRPVYLPGYVTWEHEIEHHDPLTDVQSLGLLLATLACGFDFSNPADLNLFVLHRRNLFAIRPNLHPVLASLILRMTELDRRRRPPDLIALLHTLENYRDQKVEFDLDLARTAGFQTRDLRGKQQLILAKLRDRLFDLSKRNSLLQFRSTLQNVNLTHASIPLLLDWRNIRQEQILVANDQLLKQIVSGKPISLNKYLNFAEALYLPALLDRIITDVRRDQNEFGFAQLRLVLCSLSWANLKERPIERFVSPLVLLPVRLAKTKGVRDTYHVEPLGTEAEINPVVRHQFSRLYNIELPESLDLATGSLTSLYELLAQNVQASEPAVSVQLLDRPRVDLIHEKAKRRMDQYRRTARLTGRGVRTYQNQDYSYDPANFHPLGLKLFSAQVRPPQTRLQAILENRPRPRSYMTGDSVNPEKISVPSETLEQERSLYQVRDTAEENPYLWNFDLCSVTLANFHYRRMSLVRDYEAIQDRQLASVPFDETFAVTPRLVGRELPTVPAIADRFDVVPCDPTQATAIAEARRGTSYIIQGPPGTGKSQTITNLIADYVAQGKRVLFVCEKRAAIDVVYARLKQTGLGALSCLIHDSQSDKKEFILDLKQTYEALTSPVQTGTEERQRNARSTLLQALDQNLEPLERFDEVMQTAPETLGLPVREFLNRCVALAARMPELSAEAAEGLPPYSDWHHHRATIEALLPSLLELEPSGVWARHPLRFLSPDLVRTDRPIELVTRLVPVAQESAHRLIRILRSSEIASEFAANLGQVQELLKYLQEVFPLAKNGNIGVTDSQNPRGKEFSTAMNHVRKHEDELRQARAATVRWKHKLAPVDLAAAMEQAQRFSQQSFPYFSLAWWRLRQVMRTAYDFRAHAVRPSWLQVLTTLQQEYAASEKNQLAIQAVQQQFGFERTPSEFAEVVRKFQQKLAGYPASLQRIHQGLLQSDNAELVVNNTLAAVPIVEELSSTLSQFVVDYLKIPLTQLAEDLAGILSAIRQLPRAMQWLGQLGKLPPQIGETFRSRTWAAPEIEAAIARQGWDVLCRQNRELASYSGGLVNRSVTELESQFDQWLDSNAQEIMSRVKDRFLDHVRSANQTSGAVQPAEREFRKAFNQGRRTLEHEFGKTMRYKSIRELVDGPSGLVIRDLKPVWLMSPLSVSDTLPLSGDFFDVVIFDEASQVPLEEAVPAIFRGQQVIVVGDEMQLPPTDFFASKEVSDEDEQALTFESAGETVQVDLTSDSFLSHAAKNLPATMLGWHYRSRSESLISFSNWAFYDGRLLTVPDCRLRQTDSLSFPSTESETSGTGTPTEPIPSPTLELDQTLAESRGTLGPADSLLANPLSFHYLPYGVYENRRNRSEAEYIAKLVRDLLTRPERLSLAIIAFSEAQQLEIEGALHRLAVEDEEFGQKYEAELQREDDGQF